MGKNIQGPKDYQQLGDGHIYADFVENHGKKYKMHRDGLGKGLIVVGSVIAGVAIAALYNHLTGEYEINIAKKDNTTTEDAIVESDIEELDAAFEKVTEFVDDFNTSKARDIRTSSDNDKLLAVSFDQTMASYTFVNDLSNERFAQIYAGNEITRVEIDTKADEFTNIMKLYYGRAITSSGYSSMIDDQKSRKLFEKFEDMVLEYNKKSIGDRVEYASYIIEEFQSFVDNKSSLKDYDPGVVLFISKVFPQVYYVAWQNSTVQFPIELLEELNQIKSTYCNIVYSNLEERITYLSVHSSINADDQSTNNYLQQRKSVEENMVGRGYYGLEDAEYLVKNASDFFTNGNYKAKTVSQTTTTVTKPKVVTPPPAPSKPSAPSVIVDDSKDYYTEEEIDYKNLYEEIKGRAYEDVADSDIYDIMFDAYKVEENYDRDDVEDERDDLIDDFKDDLDDYLDDYPKTSRSTLLKEYKSALDTAINRTKKNAKRDAEDYIEDKEKALKKQAQNQSSSKDYEDIKNNSSKESDVQVEVKIEDDYIREDGSANFDGDVTLQDGTKLSDYIKGSSTSSSAHQLNDLKAMRSLLYESINPNAANIDLNDDTKGKSI
ncbi:MAG: hypothetical protein PHE54_02980 [Bacilli bacterium]|nr:hypothetical protein [Bacilli bacterium]